MQFQRWLCAGALAAAGTLAACSSDDGMTDTRDMSPGAAVDALLPDLAVAPKCTAASCGGCCEGDVCQPGVSASACGSKGDACRACAPTELCGMDGACAQGVQGTYEVTFERAAIDSRKLDGSCWDFPCGDPDPFVVVNASNTRVANDTLFPVWFDTFTTTYADLSAGNFVIKMMDEDVSNHDQISPAMTLHPSDSELRAGKMEIARWGAASRVQISFKKK